MTFLYLIPNGLSSPDHPEWGSWAGRYGLNPQFPGKRYYHANQQDTWRGTTHRDNVVARWAADLQNDFKARMDWCVQPFAKANHPPLAVAKLLRQNSAPITSDQWIDLDSSESLDPDGQAIQHQWFIYKEAGTVQAVLDLENADSPKPRIRARNVSEPCEAHLILRVQDQGDPPLSRYARVILRFVP